MISLRLTQMLFCSLSPELLRVSSPAYDVSGADTQYISLTWLSGRLIYIILGTYFVNTFLQSAVVKIFLRGFLKGSDKNKIELITCSLELIKTKHITKPQLFHDFCVRENLTRPRLVINTRKHVIKMLFFKLTIF